MKKVKRGVHVRWTEGSEKQTQSFGLKEHDAKDKPWAATWILKTTLTRVKVKVRPS